MSSLQEEIELQRAQIRTDAYPMSVGEWIALYENNEIDIHPEFQRYFRWTPLQKTRLIESLLLGIPIPPIFVAQRPDGVWDVVDGLQRLSTIYEFVGILLNENGESLRPLILEKTKDLPSFEGKKWDDEYDPENSFTQTQRLFVKRAKIGASIILAGSDSNSKYELFQRLNTGGSPLTDQELRNSMMVSLNSDFYRWMRDLSEDKHFLDCVILTERANIEQYDMELVLRFLVLRKLDKNKLTTTAIGDINEFLTDQMVKMAKAKDFNYDEEGRAFRRTFEILADATGENSFRRYDVNRGKFVGSFLITPFEVVALGIGYNFQRWDNADPTLITERVKRMWRNEEITNSSGSGIRANTRIAKTVVFGRQLFAP